MIRFGSRVDVYLPAATLPLVGEGQTAIAGETVLAEFKAASRTRRFGRLSRAEQSAGNVNAARGAVARSRGAMIRLMAFLALRPGPAAEPRAGASGAIPVRMLVPNVVTLLRFAPG